MCSHFTLTTAPTLLNLLYMGTREPCYVTMEETEREREAVETPIRCRPASNG